MSEKNIHISLIIITSATLLITLFILHKVNKDCKSSESYTDTDCKCGGDGSCSSCSGTVCPEGRPGHNCAITCANKEGQMYACSDDRECNSSSCGGQGKCSTNPFDQNKGCYSCKDSSGKCNGTCSCFSDGDCSQFGCNSCKSGFCY